LPVYMAVSRAKPGRLSTLAVQVDTTRFRSESRKTPGFQTRLDAVNRTLVSLGMYYDFRRWACIATIVAGLLRDRRRRAAGIGAGSRRKPSFLLALAVNSDGRI